MTSAPSENQGDHDTPNDDSRDVRRKKHTSVLAWVLALNAGFMVAEVIGGLTFGSLALLADAAHMVSDVTGLAIALGAQRLLLRPTSDAHSYGFQRAEVLAAQANGAILLATAGWVVVEAIRRLGSAPEVEAGGMLVIASLGLAANVISVAVLARSRGESLNMRGAFIHMAADAVGSVGVIIAGIAALGSVFWVDPAVSLLLGLLITWSAVRLLLESTHILMEGTPRHLEQTDVIAAIEAVPGVTSVHHLHIWLLASDTTALSAHILVQDIPSLDEAQTLGDNIRSMLTERFEIEHTTLEMEDHPCD